MTRTRFLVALSLGVAFALACRRKPPPPAPQATASAKPAKSAVSFEPEPEQAPAVEGPAPKDAPPAERERAVISLLRGQRPANRYPVVATDDGGAVDPALREVLSPRAPPSVEPAKGLGHL